MRTKVLRIVQMTGQMTGLLAAGLSMSVLAGDITRTAEGLPDISGTYDIATITPLQRPEEFGDNMILTPELAQETERRVAAQKASRNQASAVLLALLDVLQDALLLPLADLRAL